MTLLPATTDLTRCVDFPSTLLGITLLGLVLGGGSLRAADFTAQSLSGGLWQSAALWNVTPGGSVNGYPDNTGSDIFDVTVPSAVSFDLNADVSIRDLTVANGITFQNASGRTLTIGRNFTVDGTFATQSGLALVLAGTSQINGHVSLLNGASALNQGNVTIGGSGAGALLFSADPSPGSSGYTLRNTGTIAMDRNATMSLQNFVIQNTGTFEVRRGTMSQFTSYTQTAGSTRILDGAQMQGNQISFNGGTVFVSGNAVNGSSIGFNGATLEIGPTSDVAGAAVLAGNFGSINATFQFDLGGTTQGTDFDLLNLPNGANLGQITLAIRLINGFAPDFADEFRIMTGMNLNGTFLNESGGEVNLPGLGNFTVLHGNGFVDLTGFTPIPEPGLLPLAGLALLATVCQRWRGRRRKESPTKGL